jgi:hypothetical protein
MDLVWLTRGDLSSLDNVARQVNDALIIIINVKFNIYFQVGDPPSWASKKVS